MSLKSDIEKKAKDAKKKLEEDLIKAMAGAAKISAKGIIAEATSAIEGTEKALSGKLSGLAGELSESFKGAGGKSAASSLRKSSNVHLK